MRALASLPHAPAGKGSPEFGELLAVPAGAAQGRVFQLCVQLLFGQKPVASRRPYEIDPVRVPKLRRLLKGALILCA